MKRFVIRHNQEYKILVHIMRQAKEKGLHFGDWAASTGNMEHSNLNRGEDVCVIFEDFESSHNEVMVGDNSGGHSVHYRDYPVFELPRDTNIAIGTIKRTPLFTN